MLKKVVAFVLVGLFITVSCTQHKKGCKKSHKNKKKLHLAPGFK